MKIVRFRARTVVAAAAISLICFIALIRTSYFFIGNDDHNQPVSEKRHHISKTQDKVPDRELPLDQIELAKKFPNRKVVETNDAASVDDNRGGVKSDSVDKETGDRRAFKVVDKPEEPGDSRKIEESLPSDTDQKTAVTVRTINNNLNEDHKYPILPKVDNNGLGPVKKPGHNFNPAEMTSTDSMLVPAFLRPDQNGVKPKHPILTPDGKFIPSRRIVHLDLKGAAPKVEYFEKFFEMIANIGATGILLEYEETFPFSGALASIRAANAYSDAQVKQILSWASKYNLEVIPLIQTFGHLEWILKHEKFAHFREVERYAQVICLSNMEAVDLVKNAIDQIMQFHKHTSDFVHIGADEAFQIGMCNKCQQTIKSLENNRDRLMIRHIANISSYVRNTYGKRVLMWHDMLNNADPQVMKEYKLEELVEPVIWAYAENLNEYLTSDTWYRFSSNFPYIWGASAFKGADGPSRYYSNVPHYLKNHVSWNEQMNREYKHFREFRGLILTGWQRFDHFAILCELLPVGIPSLIINLFTVNYGRYDREILQFAARAMQCNGNFEIDLPYGGVGGYCQFPGAKIYQLVQQFYSSQKNLQTQLFDDYQVHGWLSDFNVRHNYSSAWYLDQITDKILMYKNEFTQLHANLRLELSKVFHNDTVEEFLFEYIEPDVSKLIKLDHKAKALAAVANFPARPFPIRSRMEQKDKDRGQRAHNV